jgi:hypothetical protein
MRSYIFITKEGYTFQPGSESVEPDVENCQVIGFAQGDDERQAFESLVGENPYLLDTTFEEIICVELKHTDYFKHQVYFNLSDQRAKRPTHMN